MQLWPAKQGWMDLMAKLESTVCLLAGKMHTQCSL